jgi:hypothetical protein
VGQRIKAIVLWLVALVVYATTAKGRAALRARWTAWRERRALLKTWRKAAPQEQFATMINILNANPHFRRAMRKALRVKGDPRMMADERGDDERRVVLAGPGAIQ